MEDGTYIKEQDIHKITHRERRGMEEAYFYGETREEAFKRFCEEKGYEFVESSFFECKGYVNGGYGLISFHCDKIEVK